MCILERGWCEVCHPLAIKQLTWILVCWGIISPRFEKRKKFSLRWNRFHQEKKRLATFPPAAWGPLAFLPVTLSELMPYHFGCIYWLEGRRLKGRRLHKGTPGKKLKVKVAQSCLTLCDPMDYTIHGIPQARILEWVAFPFTQGIFPTQGSNPGRFFTSWATREAQDTLRQGLLRLSGSLPVTRSCKFREGTLLIQGHIGGKW